MPAPLVIANLKLRKRHWNITIPGIREKNIEKNHSENGNRLVSDRMLNDIILIQLVDVEVPEMSP